MVNRDNSVILKQFHEAVEVGNRSIIDQVLERYPELLNYPNRDGNTALHILAWSRKHLLITDLIKKGANPNIQNMHGDYPLHIAAKFGSVKNIATLLQNGAKIEVVNNNGETPLQSAASHIEAKRIFNLKILIKKSANFEHRDNNGDTALQLAVKSNKDLEVIEFLLKEGADTENKNGYGHTALHDASFNQELEVVKKLLQYGANPLAKNSHGDVALHLASKSNSAKIIDQLVNAEKSSVYIKNNYGQTPLNIAANIGNKESVNALLKSMDIHKLPRNNNLLHDMVWQRNNGSLKLLLKHGMNPDIQDTNGDTPLHLSVKKEVKEATQHLLYYGVNLGAQNKQGHTALHDAVFGMKTDAIITLLDHSLFQTNFLFLSALLNHSENIINLVNKDGDTVLHLAVKSLDQEMVRIILEYNPDLEIKNKDGLTPLEMADFLNKNELIDLLELHESEQVIQI